jgi:hypothetical protein
MNTDLFISLVDNEQKTQLTVDGNFRLFRRFLIAICGRKENLTLEDEKQVSVGSQENQEEDSSHPQDAR